MTKQLSEHEQLKAICDEIGYESEFDYDDWPKSIWNQYDRHYFTECDNCTGKNRIVDVREIIFTPEFMSKYIDYLNTKDYDFLENTFEEDLLNHLDDPVSYLYNLLKLWNKN